MFIIEKLYYVSFNILKESIFFGQAYTRIMTNNIHYQIDIHTRYYTWHGSWSTFVTWNGSTAIAPPWAGTEVPNQG